MAETRPISPALRHAFMRLSFMRRLLLIVLFSVSNEDGRCTLAEFIGREQELAELGEHLERVAGAIGEAKPGRCLLLRGRRRVGKSRLVEQFAERTGAVSMYFTASRSGSRELELFVEEGATSSLPSAATFAGQHPLDWEAALRLLAQVLPDDQASIVVIDEVPYLIEGDSTFEATLQKMWDRVLSAKPVLLVLVGSDVSMMEALSSHGRPFFQRGLEMVVPALSPVETMAFVGAKDASAGLDAYLVTGGLPLLCDEWRQGTSLLKFLTSQLRSSTSPLIVSAERVLAAEFPSEVQARDVLSVIGHGERTFTKIQTRLAIAQGSLARSLELLVTKGVVAKELPLSKSASKESRYRVADSYLRFWLYFIGPYLDEIERGRSDLVTKRIVANFSVWRGKAIEPIVREAMMRLAPICGVKAPVVGGYWTRTNDVEVDIVGADRVPAKQLELVGSIKWRDTQPFAGKDLGELLVSASRIPGYVSGVPTVGVSRTGFSASPDIALGPEELVEAWSSK